MKSLKISLIVAMLLIGFSPNSESATTWNFDAVKIFDNHKDKASFCLQNHCLSSIIGFDFNGTIIVVNYLSRTNPVSLDAFEGPFVSTKSRSLTEIKNTCTDNKVICTRVYDTNGTYEVTFYTFVDGDPSPKKPKEGDAT